MRDYKVYRADSKDNSYTRDYYRFHDRTVQLLVKSKEISDRPSADEIDVQKAEDLRAMNKAHKS